MLEFEPSAMAHIAQWLQHNGIVFIAGVLVGSLITGVGVLTKLARLGRETN